MLGLGLCQKSDPSEVDAQYRNGRFLSEFGGAQKCAVTTENQNQLASDGSIRAGMNNRDVETRRREARGFRHCFDARAVCFVDEDSQPDSRPFENLPDSLGGFRDVTSTRVCDKKDLARLAVRDRVHWGPSSTALRIMSSTEGIPSVSGS